MVVIIFLRAGKPQTGESDNLTETEEQKSP